MSVPCTRRLSALSRAPVLICGMALEPRTVSLEEEANPELADMTRRFWISVLLTVPLLLLAMSDMLPGQPVQHAFSARLLTWVQLLFATPVVLWGGWPLFRAGRGLVVNRSLNMFTLIALGTGTAYGFSVLATLLPDIFPAFLPHPYGSRGRLLRGGGRYHDPRAPRARSSNSVPAARPAVRFARSSAWRRRRRGVSGTMAPRRMCALDQVQPGDRLRVRPGENIPVDGACSTGAVRWTNPW